MYLELKFRVNAKGSGGVGFRLLRRLRFGIPL